MADGVFVETCSTRIARYLGCSPVAVFVFQGRAFGGALCIDFQGVCRACAAFKPRVSRTYCEAAVRGLGCVPLVVAQG